MKHDVNSAEYAIREGRFQRWLSLIAGLSSFVSGLEVAYEHYRGSYSRRVMYTPVILSAALGVVGIGGFFRPKIARTALPVVSAITLLDAGAGFIFHIQGIHRKPGGWRLPITNMVMGPPIFAPLLFGIAAYLGLIASMLQSSDQSTGLPQAAHEKHWGARLGGAVEKISDEQDIREGRFQRQMALAACISAGLSGFESWYSHYKNNFRFKVQWSPVLIAPALMVVAAGSIVQPRLAQTALPAMSAIAVLDGQIGFYFHVRGALLRPGGAKKLFYNTVYGPPVFAPLLFAAAGALGLLASMLRREQK